MVDGGKPRAMNVTAEEREVALRWESISTADNYSRFRMTLTKITPVSQLEGEGGFFQVPPIMKAPSVLGAGEGAQLLATVEGQLEGVSFAPLEGKVLHVRGVVRKRGRDQYLQFPLKRAEEKGDWGMETQQDEATGGEEEKAVLAHNRAVEEEEVGT